MFVLGDSITTVMPSLPDACFNHIVTDIPYGIDMENLAVANKESVTPQHEVEANVEMMPEFLAQSFRLLRDGGFCVFFYDLDHHEKLQTWAAAAGFAVQRWPFVATKTSACSNQGAAYNLTKNYEVCMFLRKPAAVLRHDPKFALNNSSWRAYDFAAERKLYANPFAKPFELWKDIFDMIAFPGQSIYDPYAGECSSLRAAANCGLTPFGSEISEIHYNRGVENLKAVYARIHAGNVNFT
jgi:DNA modification methylase